MTFILFGIIDQWFPKNETHRSFIGEAVPCVISFIIDIDDVDVNQFFHFFCSCVSSRTRTYTCRHGLRDQKNSKVCKFWNESEDQRAKFAQKLHYQIAHKNI